MSEKLRIVCPGCGRVCDDQTSPAVDRAEAQLRQLQLRHRVVVLAACIWSGIIGFDVALDIQGCEGKADGAEPSLWRVTAYCPCKKCCGPKACGITASGTKADHRLVAGPPEIPFGTVVEVPGYGRCKVEDRGGAIRGKRLDVLFQTHAEARAWGVKWMRVRGL